MKCFSLEQQGYVTDAGIPGINGMGAYYIVDAHPTARPGFNLEPSDRTLKVGFTQSIRASEKLLVLPPAGGAIERSGKIVSVLRASIEGTGEQAVLIPERNDDTENALVYIDVGAGYCQYIRYQTGKATVVRHACTAGEEGHERLLVVLKPFEPIVAVRSEKRWILWGAEKVRETLTIRFDGKNVFYDVQPPPRW